jgi:predicted dehydrogenase
MPNALKATPLSHPTRAAVIGCGGMGRHHIHALATLPAVELVGISDIFAPNLARAGDEVNLPDVRRFLDYRQLLDEAKPEIVVIATQAPQHAELTIAAAQRGIHVLCEKPLALNLVEADRMVAACEANGVRLATNHLRRVSPASTVARDLIGAGEIGEILAVDIHDKGGRPVGNTLMEMATHYFDEARFLLSRYVQSDGRRADEVEWLFARLTTGLGAEAHAATADEVVPSQVAKPTDRDCGLVVGERGTVVIGLAGVCRRWRASIICQRPTTTMMALMSSVQREPWRCAAALSNSFSAAKDTPLQTMTPGNTSISVALMSNIMLCPNNRRATICANIWR